MMQSSDSPRASSPAPSLDTALTSYRSYLKKEEERAITPNISMEAEVNVLGKAARGGDKYLEEGKSRSSIDRKDIARMVGFVRTAFPSEEIQSEARPDFEKVFES